METKDNTYKKLFRCIKDKYLKIDYYFRYTIWYDDFSSRPPFLRSLLRGYKIFAVTIKKFMKDRCLFRSSELSYFSVLAVVPLFAIFLGILKGFGLENLIEEHILSELNHQSSLWTYVVDFARNMLLSTSGGVIAGIGVLFLFWIIINVLTSIELALNDIWGVKRQRSLLRKTTDYLSIVLLAPLCILLTVSAKMYVTNSIVNTIELGFLQSVFLYLMAITPYLSYCVFFVLLFIILPNKRIPFKSALISGILTGVLFTILQYVYTDFQKYMNSYNIVYGSFAALPLFLLWLRFTWVLVLFGAEFGFTLIHVDKYIFENDYKFISEKNRKIYALQIVCLLIQAFKDRLGPQGVKELSETIKIPQTYVYKIANELVEMKILNRVYASGKANYDAQYQPAFDIYAMKFSTILKAINYLHTQSEFKPKDAVAYTYFEQILLNFESLIEESDENTSLVEIADRIYNPRK